MHTNAFFSIVKSKVVPAAIVAALMDQLSCPAVLGIGHYGNFLFDSYRRLSDRQKPLPIYPNILKTKRRPLLKINLRRIKIPFIYPYIFVGIAAWVSEKIIKNTTTAVQSHDGISHVSNLYPMP